MGKTAVLFAGQGAQTPGMGKDLYESDPVYRQTFDGLDARCPLDLKELCFEASQDVLNQTANAQPALAAMELAAFRTLESRRITADAMAGLSLGEYTALAAAGAIRDKDLSLITARRGALMEEALPPGSGSMLAVLSDQRADIEAVCKQIQAAGHLCDLANINAPDQFILSGDESGLAQARALLKDRGIRRAVPLKVSGPFHSSALREASGKLEQILNEYDIRYAALPVVFNVSGEAETLRDGDDVRRLLVRQLYSPVQFDAVLDTLLDAGADTFIEIGPGQVLSRLVRKKAPQARIFSLASAEDLQRIEEGLNK